MQRVPVLISDRDTIARLFGIGIGIGVVISVGV